MVSDEVSLKSNPHPVVGYTIRTCFLIIILAFSRTNCFSFLISKRRCLSCLLAKELTHKHLCFSKINWATETFIRQLSSNETSLRRLISANFIRAHVTCKPHKSEQYLEMYPNCDLILVAE